MVIQTVIYQEKNKVYNNFVEEIIIYIMFFILKTKEYIKDDLMRDNERHILMNGKIKL